MPRISYFSPFVPPEWIAAHGLQPAWLVPDRRRPDARDVNWRGICACAAAVVAGAESDTTSAALVLSTACDQMRYAAACVDTRGHRPVFLFHVPSTWQAPQVRVLYREELRRLGRFLIQVGGRAPTTAELIETIERFDDRRRAVRAELPGMTARQRTEAMLGLRGDSSTEIPAGSARGRLDGMPLLLLGGPSLEPEDFLIEMLERAGGRVVVDATETGQRTLPGPVDHDRLRTNPLDELVRIYFDTIPDVFRRPNSRLYDWLDRQLSTHTVRGMVVRRYPFCDLWHAEVYRLRRRSDVPVLDIDVGAGDEGERSRIQGRIEAFLEMLR